jgi:uncharacterized protein YcfL
MKNATLIFLVSFLITACSQPTDNQLELNSSSNLNIDILIDGNDFSKSTSLDVTAISNVISSNGQFQKNSQVKTIASARDYVSEIHKGDTLQIKIHSNSASYTFNPTDAKIVDEENYPTLQSKIIANDSGNYLNIWIDSEDFDEFVGQEVKYNIYFKTINADGTDSNTYVIDPKLKGNPNLGN